MEPFQAHESSHISLQMLEQKAHGSELRVDNVSETWAGLSEPLARIAQNVNHLSAQQENKSSEIVLLGEQVQNQKQELLKLWQKVGELADLQENVADLQENMADLRENVQTNKAELIEIRQSINGLKLPKETDENGNAEEKDEHALRSHLSTATAVQFLDDDSEHCQQLGGSIWNAVFFIGSPLLCWGGSIMSGMVLALNIVIQFMFTNIVYMRFTYDPFTQSDVDGYTRWRSNVAHQYVYMDPIRGTSLASRVCSDSGGRSSLAVSTEQSNVVETVRSYLEEDDGSFWSILVSGPCLCTIALICWFSTIAVEFWTMYGILKGVNALPYTSSTIFDVESNEIVLRSLGMLHRIFLYLIILLKVFIGIAITIAGTLYVVYTVNVRDLLLNCVSLAFVIGIDELLFEAFAPRRLIHIVTSLKPLRWKRVAQWRGSDGTSGILMLALIAGTITTVFSLLLPMVTRIRETERVLCDGHLDFVYTVGVSGQIYWGKSVASGAAYVTYQERAVQEILGVDSGYASTHLSTNVASAMAVGDYSKQSLQDVTTTCRVDLLDIDHRAQAVMQSEVRKAIMLEPLQIPWLEAGNVSVAAAQRIERCAHFQWLCYDVGDVGVKMRAYCSHTCGCDSLQIFTLHPEKGCDDTCDEVMQWHVNNAWGREVTNLKDSQCADASVEQVTSNPFIISVQDYVTKSVKFLSAANGSYGADSDMMQALSDYVRKLQVAPNFKDFLREFHKRGCEAIPANLDSNNISACMQPAFKYFLHAMCPVSCGCTEFSGARASKPCPRMCFIDMLRQSTAESLASLGMGQSSQVIVTTTVVAALAGAMEIQVANMSGIAPDMSLTISDSTNSETKIVASVMGNRMGPSNNSRRLAAGFVVVDSPLEHDYDAGASISVSKASADSPFGPELLASLIGGRAGMQKSANSPTGGRAEMQKSTNSPTLSTGRIVDGRGDTQNATNPSNGRIGNPIAGRVDAQKGTNSSTSSSTQNDTNPSTRSTGNLFGGRWGARRDEGQESSSGMTTSTTALSENSTWNAQGARASTFAPSFASYKIAQSGTCETDGMATISDPDACLVAGAALSGNQGISYEDDQPAGGYSYAGRLRPNGCVLHHTSASTADTSTWELQFFTSAIGDCGAGNRYCVCVQAAPMITAPLTTPVATVSASTTVTMSTTAGSPNMTLSGATLTNTLAASAATASVEAATTAAPTTTATAGTSTLTPAFVSYKIVQSATCETEGMATIFDPSACLAAGAALSGNTGISYADDQPAGGYSNTGRLRPKGCALHESFASKTDRSTWEMELFPSATGNCGAGKRYCVCAQAAPTATSSSTKPTSSTAVQMTTAVIVKMTSSTTAAASTTTTREL